MTAEAPPTKARKATRRRTPTLAALKEAEEADLIRWTPEEVVEKKLLPYTSVRMLKEKCYKRQVYCHLDGGRITFSPMSIRMEHQRTLVAPLAA